MRTRTARKTTLVVAAGALFLGAVQAQAAEIAGSVSGQVITMTLTPGNGEAVVGTLNDLVFQDGGPTIPEIIDPGSTLSAALTADGGTISVADASNLPDFGVVQIDDERIAYESKNGNDLVVATDGQDPPTVTGRGQDGTTAAEHASGATVGVPTSLPQCEMTAALAGADKSAVFSFLPEGCTPGTDCDGVRAIVIALDNLSELTSPIALYTCNTEGEGDLVCPEDDATDPFQPAQSSRTPTEEGNDLLPTTCSGPTGIPSGGDGCAGDCNNDGEVTLGEVQVAFNIFLGNADLDDCTAANANGDDEVTLGEVQVSFNNFLQGCPVP